jgi:hypothetical protein
MDLSLIFVLGVLFFCVWGLLWVRNDRSVEREEEVEIVQNLSEPRRKQHASLSHFFFHAPPIVLCEDTDEIDPSAPVDNILISREYPLIPFRRFGSWVSPGTTMTVTVRTNSKGDVISITSR